MEGSISTEQQVKTSLKQLDVDQACLSAQLLCSSMVFPAVLNAAVELNLFEIIAKASPECAGISATEVASMLPTQHPELPHRLERMLRCLASHSLLICSTRKKEDGTTETLFELSPIGRYYVCDGNGSLALRTTLLFTRTSMETLFHFKDAILDPDNDLFMKVHGSALYEYKKEEDQKHLDILSQNTPNTWTYETKRILEIYGGFEGISTLVDVGGSSGKNLQLIVSKYPSIKGINFDLPQVIQHAPAHPGIEHVGGDMFAGVPKGDAIIMKGVLHNWSDGKCLQLLRNCHKALPANGKVIVVDLVMPEAPDSSDVSKHISNLDNIMFITFGGRERTLKDLEDLCKRSGFSEFQLVCRAFSVLGVMEFRK